MKKGEEILKYLQASLKKWKMKHKIEKKAFKRVDISHVLELKALQQELIKRERDW